MSANGPSFISLQVRDLERSASFYEKYLGFNRGTTITSAPVDGPFGRTFTFADTDGYRITLHDRA